MPAPDERKLTAIQIRRLAALAKVEASELHGLTIAQAAQRLKWQVDPLLFWFRKVCGQVVKKDPVTGVEYPVPFATVNVQDTDCDLISYFPEGWRWGWHFPLFCRRETIATVKTDACGKFCVWIPRFDIDWILTWREERICYPIIFTRPSLGDLLPQPQPVPSFPPRPDPGPLAALTTLPLSTVEAVAGSPARALADRLQRLETARTLGGPSLANAGLLARRAFDADLPPPLPAEFRQAMAGRAVAAKGANALEGVRSALAHKLGVDPAHEALANFEPHRFIGPFLRCYDILLPEWRMVLEVPDITFEVTQEIGGVQQVIYDDPFGVNWSLDPAPDITLVAWQNAIESHVCEAPPVACGDVPAILFAGLMPLDNPSYFDATNGYALRPNRPAVTLVPPPPRRHAATTPFCETLQLYGCVNVTVGGVAAQYWRVMQSVGGGPQSAITGLSWNIYTFPGGIPTLISPDADGWYQVLPNPDDFHPARMVLEWPTPTLGKYTLTLQVADGAKTVLAESDPVAIQVDNTAPAITYTELAWKFAGAPDSTFASLLGLPCPIIHRGTSPADIEVAFAVNVAANHLRDCSISVGGCGGASFVLETSTETSHWYTSPGDDNVNLSGRYKLSAGAPDGCYSFAAWAASRAMNPSGADGGNLVPPDWFEDVVYIYSNPSVAVTVVSEN